MSRSIFLLAGLACLAIFAGLRAAMPVGSSLPEATVSDRVVIAAPVQLLLAGGDQFLAANFEAIRLAATSDASMAGGSDDAAFRIRAHRVVAQLNPCHEDNYYVGNALLSWGGAPEEGSDLLRRATGCRTWDEFPPFFLGFNEQFFNRNAAGAQHAFEIAAQRSVANAPIFRRMAIMVAAGELDDERMAVNYLKSQRDGADDPRLRDMLDKRVVRLEGLLSLREAQRRYEERFGKPLTDPVVLISSGLLSAFPTDPLRLGYTFANGRFELRKLEIDGMEGAQ
jgi:hypothetical protein